MKIPVNWYARQNFLSNISKFQREKAGSGLYSATLTAFVAILLVSGCEIAPDRTLVSSISGEVHHSNISNKKREVSTPEKVAAMTPRVQTVSYGFLGQAPYICTPSGFGRTSSCFRRG